MVHRLYIGGRDGDPRSPRAEFPLIFAQGDQYSPADIALGEGVPAGTIVIWGGEDIPEGWLLCDGSNGTPDLSGRRLTGTGGGAVPITLIQKS